MLPPNTNTIEAKISGSMAVTPNKSIVSERARAQDARNPRNTPRPAQPKSLQQDAALQVERFGAGGFFKCAVPDVSYYTDDATAAILG